MNSRCTAVVAISIMILAVEVRSCRDPDSLQESRRTKQTVTAEADLPHSAQNYVEDGVVISSGSQPQRQQNLKPLLTSPGQASVRDITASHRRFLQDKRGPSGSAPAPAPRGMAYAPAVSPAVSASAATGIDPANLRLGALSPPVVPGGYSTGTGMGVPGGTGMTIGGFSFSGR